MLEEQGAADVEVEADPWAAMLEELAEPEVDIQMEEARAADLEAETGDARAEGHHSDRAAEADEVQDGDNVGPDVVEARAAETAVGTHLDEAADNNTLVDEARAAETAVVDHLEARAAEDDAEVEEARAAEIIASGEHLVSSASEADDTVVDEARAAEADDLAMDSGADQV